MLFSMATADRSRRNRLKLHQGKFSLEIRENFLTQNGQALEQAT